MPTEQERADLSKKRGQAAAQIQDPEEKKRFIAAQGDAEKKGKTDSDTYSQLDKEADNTLATGGANKSVGVYDKGGKVGPTWATAVSKVNVNDGKHEAAILKHGERVLTEKQNDKFEKTPMGKAIAAEDKLTNVYDKGGMCYDQGGVVGPHRAAYLRGKMNAPKDGTSLSGFVTEKDNKPPRECGNCKWMKAEACTHPLVMIDPEVKGVSGKPKPVDSDDCCDNFQNKK